MGDHANTATKDSNPTPIEPPLKKNEMYYKA